MTRSSLCDMNDKAYHFRFCIKSTIYKNWSPLQKELTRMYIFSLFLALSRIRLVTLIVGVMLYLANNIHLLEASDESCLNLTFKIDCHPEPNANEYECLRRNCCWQAKIIHFEKHQPPFIGQPNCFFPSNFNCYDIKSIEPEQQQQNHSFSDDHSTEVNGRIGGPDKDSLQATILRWLLSRKSTCQPSGFLDDARQIEVEISIYDDSLINIKISEPDKRRFKPSLPKINLPDLKVRATKSVVNVDDEYGKKVRFGQLSIELTKESPSSAGVLKVIHQISGVILFETDFGKLIYSRQFIQLPTYLPSSFVYGLGQHMGDSLLKSNEGNYAKSYTMFNYGHPPKPNGRAAYSSYPFYINLAQLNHTDNSVDTLTIETFTKKFKLIATGALMLNSNAMDVLLHSTIGDRDRAGITWRLVGGIIDLYFFFGSEPHDVIYKYQSLVGNPALPPPWALGYHQSRLNYLYNRGNRELLPIKLAWAKTRSAGIPMESIWTDIDFLFRGTSYTLNSPELNDLVKALQDKFGMHYVPIVDPAISLREELDNYEALKLARGMDLFASYLPIDGIGESSIASVTTWTHSKQSGLLDFTHPHIVDYLCQVLKEYKKKLNFDGLWLDMNEPEVFANEENENGKSCPFDEKLIYRPGGGELTERTMCMAAEFKAGKHFDVHNLYAFYQSKAHYEALKILNPTKRPFIISRSQFVGQGKYSGTWLGDLESVFEDMRWSILGIIESNWFGQPLVGADICGFFGSATDELCARWFSLGAFYPFARNHNGAIRDQDPGSLGDIVQKSARLALLRRYSLLPYLYTIFYENNLKSKPVVSSVLFQFFNQFYTTLNLKDLPQNDDQLMLGSALMIAPILYPDTELRSVYLAPGRWYDISIGMLGTNMEEGPYDTIKSNWPLTNISIQLDEVAKQRLDRLRKPIDCDREAGCWLNNQYTPLGAINIYLRGGQIIPTFRRVEHTKSVGMIWKNASFFLEIALDSNEEAVGSLYWDSGESEPEAGLYNQANFWVSGNQLTVSVIEERYEQPLQFDGFIVHGSKSTRQFLKSIIYRDTKVTYTYNADTETLSCLFMTLIGDETKSLALRRFDRLVFNWM